MTTQCPSCGAPISAERSCLEMRDELFHYTLAHGGKDFIHQYVVDAYAAQHIGPKPIRLAGALIGLFLFAERGFTGREVQLAHMALGNRMKLWPAFPAPKEHAALSVMDPRDAPAGADRDEMIRKWAKSVWEMWKERHSEVERLLLADYDPATKRIRHADSKHNKRETP